jgi:hypothetical protein
MRHSHTNTTHITDTTHHRHIDVQTFSRTRDPHIITLCLCDMQVWVCVCAFACACVCRCVSLCVCRHVREMCMHSFFESIFMTNGSAHVEIEIDGWHNTVATLVIRIHICTRVQTRTQMSFFFSLLYFFIFFHIYANFQFWTCSLPCYLKKNLSWVKPDLHQDGKIELIHTHAICTHQY